ncbi:DUF4262 domain-containing protein [Chitinophaga niabensis]|uniref:DUF4262 domain-containing protein n=1 Tax=Chitinophaga niabensis TaxID=536979 RepID=A0A1N6GJ06_9BACT|nr:DUF4262 domain-containing protein [Chitinophaga niabensis]SIO07496.1 protein of unknown function [Chitinophaga niabensis]
MSIPEEDKQRILQDIEQYGCHLIMIEADNYLPAFVYSIGLYQKFGHPEIICFGLEINLMATLINDACAMVQNGEKLESNKAYPDFLENFPIRFLQVDKDFYRDYLGYGGGFYGSFDFPALQLVWPDKASNFPWNENFNPDWKFKQPLLDRNTDFKFYEERNVATFTTKQVLEGDPILYVSHNIDGDWQFHGSAEADLEDARIVCLEAITRLDPSVNQIYHLQYGWNAWRQDIHSDWEYEEGEEEAEETE